MTKEKAQHIVVISPHQDDALISLGETILTYPERTVLDIFTQSNSTITGEDDVATVTRIRHDEEMTASEKYNITITEGGFFDSEVRGIPWDNAEAAIDLELLTGVAEWLSQELAKIGDEIDLFIPAAFGLHPDHYLALLSFLVMSLQDVIKQKAKNIYLYAEQPYQVDPGATHHGLSRLGESELTNTGPEIKREMLSVYPSQLSPERIAKLSNISEEQYWHLTLEDMNSMLQEAQLRGNEGNVQIFQSNELIDATTSVYDKEGRTYERIHLANENGNEVIFPISFESMMMNRKIVKVARQAGCNTSDYSNFGDADVDIVAIETLLKTLRERGVDIMWLSNIEDDSNFMRLIKRSEQNELRILPNIPTVGTHTRLSFDNWLATKSKNMRRNVRRKRKQIYEVGLQGGQSLCYKYEPLTDSDSQWLLENQSIRSSSTSLDSLKDNLEFVHFLQKLVGDERVKVLKMQIGSETLSELLIFDDQETKTLSIYIQAMSAKWSKYSPSFCAITQLIELAHNMKYLYVDFLRGEEAYKNHFVDYKKPMSKVIYRINQSLDIDSIASQIAEIEE